MLLCSLSANSLQSFAYFEICMSFQTTHPILTTSYLDELVSCLVDLCC